MAHDAVCSCQPDHMHSQVCPHDPGRHGAGFDLAVGRPAANGDCGWADLLLFGSESGEVHANMGCMAQADLDGFWEVEAETPTETKASPSLYLNISLKPANRMQMLSNFLHTHSLSPKHAVGLNSYLTALPTMDLSMPLLQATIDALCYASMHTYAAYVESRACYTKALSLLQAEVQRPPIFQERHRPVLMSMVMLCLYELAARKGDGWIAHIHGAQMYLNACGPTSLSAPMDYLLFHNLRLCALCLGLYERKRVLLASPEWMRIAAQYSSRNWKGVLFDLAMTVPGLIEATDALGTRPEEDQDLCDRIESVRTGLETWNAQKSREDGRYKVVHVGTMDAFAALMQDATFLAVFRFRSVETFRLHGLYWICGASLNVAMLKILDAHDAVDMKFGETTYTRSAVESQLYVFATNLCRSIPYCYKHAPEFTRWYLSFAEEFLRRCDNAHREGKWCRKLHAALEMTKQQRDGCESKQRELKVELPRNLNKIDPVFLICELASNKTANR